MATQHHKGGSQGNHRGNPRAKSSTSFRRKAKRMVEVENPHQVEKDTRNLVIAVATATVVALTGVAFCWSDVTNKR